MFILRNEKYDKDGLTFRFTPILQQRCSFRKEQPSSNHNKPYELSRMKLLYYPSGNGHKTTGSWSRNFIFFVYVSGRRVLG